MFECLVGENKYLVIGVEKELDASWFDLNGWNTEVDEEGMKEFLEYIKHLHDRISCQEFFHWMKISLDPSTLEWFKKYDKVEEKIEMEENTKRLRSLVENPKIVLESYKITKECNDVAGMELFGAILKKNWDVDVNAEEELNQLDFDIARGYFGSC